MDIVEIQNFLNENAESAEVQQFLSELSAVDVGKVEKFLNENEEGKRYLTKVTDTHFNKGLETWKNNHLPSLIQAELDKGNNKSPEMLKIEQLENQIEESKRQAARKELEAATVSKASEMGLPTNIALMLIGENQDDTFANLGVLSEALQAHVSKDTQRRYENKDHTPPITPSAGGKKPTLAEIASKNNLRR